MEQILDFLKTFLLFCNPLKWFCCYKMGIGKVIGTIGLGVLLAGSALAQDNFVQQRYEKAKGYYQDGIYWLGSSSNTGPTIKNDGTLKLGSDASNGFAVANNGSVKFSV